MAAPRNPWKPQLERAQDQGAFNKAHVPLLALLQLQLCQGRYISAYLLPFDL